MQARAQDFNDHCRVSRHINKRQVLAGKQFIMSNRLFTNNVLEWIAMLTVPTAKQPYNQLIWLLLYHVRFLHNNNSLLAIVIHLQNRPYIINLETGRKNTSLVSRHYIRNHNVDNCMAHMSVEAVPFTNQSIHLTKKKLVSRTVQILRKNPQK